MQLAVVSPYSSCHFLGHLFFFAFCDCSTIFEGQENNDDLQSDVQTLNVHDTQEYKEYLIMKERNARLEDEIKWLAMRANVGADDPLKQVSLLVSKHTSLVIGV